MSSVQVNADGSLVPRKLNHPIRRYSMAPGTPNGGAFRSIAVDPRITTVRAGPGVVSYPIVTLQYSSTTPYQVSYHIE